MNDQQQEQKNEQRPRGPLVSANQYAIVLVDTTKDDFERTMSEVIRYSERVDMFGDEGHYKRLKVWNEKFAVVPEGNPAPYYYATHAVVEGVVGPVFTPRDGTNADPSQAPQPETPPAGGNDGQKA